MQHVYKHVPLKIGIILRIPTLSSAQDIFLQVPIWSTLSSSLWPADRSARTDQLQCWHSFEWFVLFAHTSANQFLCAKGLIFLHQQSSANVSFVAPSWYIVLPTCLTNSSDCTIHLLIDFELLEFLRSHFLPSHGVQPTAVTLSNGALPQRINETKEKALV